MGLVMETPGFLFHGILGTSWAVDFSALVVEGPLGNPTAFGSASGVDAGDPWPPPCGSPVGGAGFPGAASLNRVTSLDS